MVYDQPMIKKYIFVDLDETLIHCSYLGNTEKAKKFARKGAEVINLQYDPEDNRYPEYYQCTLRTGALDLLSKLRDLPNAEVYMLTAATKDYALTNSEMFNLRFTGDRIFSREDTNLLASRVADRFKPDGDFDMFLLDNLPYSANSIKVDWLAALAQAIGDSSKGFSHSHYIQIPDYYGIQKNKQFSDPYIADIIDQIRNS